VRFAAILLLASALQAQTVDKKFIALTAYNGAATLADAASTAALLHDSCHEITNPGLYGTFPSSGRTFAIMGGMEASATLVSYVLKRKRVHIWKLPLWPAPLAFDAYWHTIGATNNIRRCW